jgi:hypothetical protein
MNPQIEVTNNAVSLRILKIGGKFIKGKIKSAKHVTKREFESAKRNI